MLHSSSPSLAAVSVRVLCALCGGRNPANITLVYLFVGTILFHDHWSRYVAGSIIGFVGAAYIALEFVPNIEPPENMREADQGWGAEQV